MRNPGFEACLPTASKTVPDRPDWIHEIKHDGYRLIVQRDGKRVRLFTRNGYDWSDRYPLITEAALRIRSSSFVLDGEAVLLGVDGRSDFDGLHSRKHNDAACLMGLEGLVSKHRDRPYRAGRSPHWIKVKNPAPPAITRAAYVDRAATAERTNVAGLELPGSARGVVTCEGGQRS